MNVITGATLGACADVVCQKKVENAESIDWRRLAAMTVFGGSYTGFAVTYIYGSYKFFLPAAAKSSSARQAVGSTMLDNLIHCPLVYTPTFYISTGMMQGQSYEEAKQELVSRYWETTTACWFFWFPATAGNFYLLPPHLIVAVMQIENFAWNIIIDYIAHRVPEAASKYVAQQMEQIPLDDGLTEQPIDAPLNRAAGGIRQQKPLANAFKKELAARFGELNQQLVEKDKTIAQLRYDLDMLQTKHDQRQREETFSSFSHQPNASSDVHPSPSPVTPAVHDEEIKAESDALVVSKQELKELISELMQAEVQANGVQTSASSGV